MRVSATTKLPSVHAGHCLWICPTSTRVGEINTRKCVYACREPRKRDSRELPANVCQATVIPSIRFNRSTSGNEATNIFAALCEVSVARSGQCNCSLRNKRETRETEHDDNRSFDNRFYDFRRRNLNRRTHSNKDSVIGERSRDKRKTVSTNVLAWQLSDCGFCQYYPMTKSAIT